MRSIPSASEIAELFPNNYVVPFYSKQTKLRQKSLAWQNRAGGGFVRSSNARSQIHLGLSPRQDDVVSRRQFDLYHYGQGSRPFLSPHSGGLYAARKRAGRGLKRRFMPHREIYKSGIHTLPPKFKMMARNMSNLLSPG
jgi:hypothetical protein